MLRWSEKSGSHFRVKARVILQRVIRKFGYVCKWGGVAGIQVQIQPAYHCSHSQFVVARNQSSGLSTDERARAHILVHS